MTVESVRQAATQTGSAQRVEVMEVVQAFDVPRLTYDSVQRKLLLDTRPRSLHAMAEVRSTSACCGGHAELLNCPHPAKSNRPVSRAVRVCVWGGGKA